MIRYALCAAVAGIAAVVVPPSAVAATPSSASIALRHQLRGCHAWSLNGGPYSAGLDVRLARGGTLTITNVDLMVQKLIRERGAAVRMRTVSHDHLKLVGLHRLAGPGIMNHMGAALEVTFPRPGTYRFRTEDLGDYFELKTAGEDNRLTLVVKVS